jgi:hypothetical protein
MNGQSVPRNFHFDAAENSIKNSKALLASNKELSNILDQIREKCLKEIHDLLGSKVNEYLAFRQKIRDRTSEFMLV